MLTVMKVRNLEYYLYLVVLTLELKFLVSNCYLHGKKMGLCGFLNDSKRINQA